jgi:FixJ family two-component response regulator
VKVLPTVFVVDDDPIIVESLEAVLAGQGHVVRTFRTAEEFLARLSSNDVGCVLIDLILPGMSGNQLWKKLAAANSLLSVIVLTGWIESLDLSWQRIPTGAVMEKPYDVSVLLSLISDGITDSLKKKCDRDRRRMQSF